MFSFVRFMLRKKLSQKTTDIIIYGASFAALVLSLVLAVLDGCSLSPVPAKYSVKILQLLEPFGG